MQIDTRNWLGQEVLIEDLVRDKITGFEGKVIGIVQWTTGCGRASVQPLMTDKLKAEGGKIPTAYDVDVLNLEVVTQGPRHAASVDPELVGAGKGGPNTVSRTR